MIWSRYNEFIPHTDGYYYLFNGRVRKWIKLVPELYATICERTENPSDIQRVHPTLYETLVKNEFLVASLENEVSSCIKEINDKLTHSKVLKLTVNPTLDCNLRCWYCYESHLHGSVMSNSTIMAISKYIGKELAKRCYSRFQLAFFGGEPLLKFKQVIKPLIDLVAPICNKYQVELAISFTTNGVCLTKEVREYLRTVSENVSFQIPFDGDETRHNHIKKFPNGRGSYDLVKRNAEEAILDGYRVTIRCNFTKENVASFDSVVKDFKHLLSYPNLRFSFHKVWQEAVNEDLKVEIKKLKKNADALSFKSNIYSYFGDSVNPCYGDYANNYVINYNGDVFKCTARDFHSEHRIGILSSNGEILYNESALNRIRNAYTSDCFVCKRLPICPICSQARSESPNGKCPVAITDSEISLNMQQYFHDLLTQSQYVNS